MILAILVGGWRESDYLLVFFTGVGGKNQRHRDIDWNIELIHIRGTKNDTTLVTFNQGNL